MATFVYPGTDRLRPEAAAMAKHYGVQVAVCPAMRPQRKGVVEKAIQYVTQSWWRSAPVSTPAQAQADLDRWCVAVSDRRRRGQSTVGELAASEPLLALPELPFGAEYREARVVSREALVEFETNRYSVPPGHAGATVEVRARLGRAAPGDLHARGPADRPAPPRARRRRADDPHRRARPRARAGRARPVHDPQGVPAQTEPAARRAGAGRGGQARRPAARRGARRSGELRADREGGRAMTDYLHHYNVVIDPEQGTRLPDGSWAQDVTLVLLDAPGTDSRRPVAVTLTPEQARELGFELLAAAEHADRTTTPQPEGDDAA